MRYFLEVSYKGTHFHGFQIQGKEMTIQGELEKALQLYFREPFSLTGSSRTDAGVHALQNFFHFDSGKEITDKQLYNLNAILSEDIVIKSLRAVRENAHARFDAEYREYQYNIYFKKDPFQKETAWYYPFRMDVELLRSAAAKLLGTHDFSSFAKRNTQVRTHICTIHKAEWTTTENGVCFTVAANRFLRGMVRALVATMLKVGRGTYTLTDFDDIIAAQDCTVADFSAPAKGLFLRKVSFPDSIFL
ncbi:MAG: tRNA pseudouridine(38-40) synthase TruA [Chitinophagaceae bacterium]